MATYTRLHETTTAGAAVLLLLTIQICWVSLRVGLNSARFKTATFTSGTSCLLCSGGETVNFSVLSEAIKKEPK